MELNVNVVVKILKKLSLLILLVSMVVFVELYVFYTYSEDSSSDSPIVYYRCELNNIGDNYNND